MKELSIKEKAARYDEAIKFAKIYHNSGDEDMKTMCKTMFPELKEQSEDDRIRKAIKKALQVRCDGSRIISDEPVTLEEAITWLEKQGEQKPTKWSEEDDKNLERAIWYVEKGGKRIFAKTDELVFWLKSIKDKVGCEVNCTTTKEWSEEDESNLDYLIDFCNGYYNGNKPVLTESTARSLSNWLYRLKSGEIQLKTYSNLGWTCEEDAVLHNACEFIRHRMHSNGNIGGMDYKVLYQKLKSLKERYTWKPSERDLGSISDAIIHYEGIGIKPNGLKELFEQLKKLKGE